MSNRLHLTLACGDYESIRALKEGTVKPDGIELTVLTDMTSDIRQWAYGLGASNRKNLETLMTYPPEEGLHRRRTRVEHLFITPPAPSNRRRPSARGMVASPGPLAAPTKDPSRGLIHPPIELIFVLA